MECATQEVLGWDVCFSYVMNDFFSYSEKINHLMINQTLL